LTENIIKWRTVLIGVVVILASYVISDIMSWVSIILPLFLLVGLLVGFIINETEKNAAINGVVFGVIGGIVTNAILVVLMSLQGYGAFIEGIIATALIYVVLEIIVAAVGGVLGSLLRIEFDKSEMEYEEVEE
jgi:Na+/proline symporter